MPKIKPPKVRSTAKVRQMRGPGMNLGLKKPRFGFQTPEEPKTAKPKQAEPDSYLPSDQLAGLGKPRAPRKGSKVLSSKLL